MASPIRTAKVFPKLVGSKIHATLKVFWWLLKVGSWSFECVIILLTYFLNVGKHFLQVNKYISVKSTE